MPLRYDRDTAVERDFKTQSNIDTEFLNQENIVGRESSIQTEQFSQSITGTGTYTTTQDIILTGVSLTAHNPASSGSQTSLAWINVNTNIIGQVTARSTATQAGNMTAYIPFPNWFIPSGTILGCTESGGDDSTAVFIGFVA